MKFSMCVRLSWIDEKVTVKYIMYEGQGFYAQWGWVLATLSHYTLMWIILFNVIINNINEVSSIVSIYTSLFYIILLEPCTWELGDIHVIQTNFPTSQ